MGIFDFLKRNKNKEPKNGKTEIYYDEGKGPLSYEGNLINGQKDGLFRFFYRNGIVEYSQVYR